jgi:aryl-alcohol dehydrogenase-like predicted oxidoreductase
MNYRRLGQTNLQVSEISLGTVELGMDYGIPTEGANRPPSEAEAAELLHRALDQGINLIDTARAYGKSEAIIGRALKSRRHEYILATKLTHLDQEELTGEALRQRVDTSIVESLRTLQTDVIDLLYIHNTSCEMVERGEIVGLMQEAQRAGHVRFIGASTYGETAPLAVLEDGRFDCLQIAYNLLDRRPEKRVLSLAQETGIGLVVRSVLLKGTLTHRYVHLPEELRELREAIQKLHSLIGSEGHSLPELAFRFVLAHPSVSTTLVGTGRWHELEEALSFVGRGPLPPIFLNRVRAISVSPDQINPSTWPFQ